MISEVKLLVFPEGDTQELFHTPRFNAVVDVNGNELPIPLKSDRQLAYRVYKVTRQEGKKETNICYHLEMLSRRDLQELC